MKNLKTMISYVVFSICMFILFYLLGAFIVMELDVRNWDLTGRYGIVCFTVISTVAYIGLNQIKKSK